jgi:hypothetical protein
LGTVRLKHIVEGLICSFKRKEKKGSEKQAEIKGKQNH